MIQRAPKLLLLGIAVLTVSCYRISDNEDDGDAGKADSEYQNATGGEPESTDSLIDTTEGVAEVLLLDNLDDGDEINAVGGSWTLSDDNEWGGNSDIWPDVPFESVAPGYGGRGRAIHVTGTTGTALVGADFLMVTTTLHEDADCPLATPTEIDMAHFDGVQFMAKGHANGAALYLRLPFEKSGPEDNCTDGYPVRLTDTSHQRYMFREDLTEEWTLLRIRYEDLFRLSSPDDVAPEEVLRELKSLEWFFMGSLGELDLWIDDVAMFRDF